LAGVRRRVDPRIDAARRHGGDRRVAAPVEGRGEAAVHLGSGDHRRRERQQGHGEAERIGIPLGHAGRGRGDADGLDFTLKARPMGRPQSVRGRIAMIVGERIGERGGGTVTDLRIAVEPGEDVARRGATQSQEGRESRSGAEREQDNAGNANGARRELPGARP
jgi:hypothetical protein